MIPDFAVRLVIDHPRRSRGWRQLSLPITTIVFAGLRLPSMVYRGAV
jgi:hypothetical protein